MNNITNIPSEKAIIVYPYLKNEGIKSSDIKSRLEETSGLARAINLEISSCHEIGVSHIKPSTYIGSGRLDDLQMEAAETGAELIIFDTKLSPIQQRNIENQVKCKVIDRTALILEIFGQRASTKEGSLQVELAAFEYQKSRLVRSWTHLERQRGGSGFMGGPGETQIESDRRQIDNKIIKLKKQLIKVAKTRALHRKSRQSTPYSIVALVGYTNAGKSTLFNRLTGADVLAEDILFATLDPTMRSLKLPSGTEIILSDTVGFISDLPTELIAAFRATLEEVVEADIILHIRDISNEETEMQRDEVCKVLHNLGLDEKLDTSSIEVLNKCDLKNIDHENQTISNSISVSALTGSGCDKLLQMIENKLLISDTKTKLIIDAHDGKKLAWLYENASILSRTEHEGKIELSVSISQKNIGRLESI